MCDSSHCTPIVHPLDPGPSTQANIGVTSAAGDGSDAVAEANQTRGGTQDVVESEFSKALSTLQEILDVLQRSKIAPPKADSWALLWNRYKSLSDEYDDDLVKRYREDMETSSIFAGLFSAVVATVASMTLPTLSADPNLKTQIVLQAILLSLNHTAGNPAEIATSVEWNGPSASVLWVQSLLYASLACSLFAALGSVMGRQWLGKYSSIGEHGTLEDRCRERQRKFDALKTWHFFSVLEAIPVLLQVSLLLFGLGLSAYMWSQTIVVTAVLIAMNGTGALAYFWLIKSSVQHPDCPFYSPLSSRLRSTPQSMSLYWGRLRRSVSSVTSASIAFLNIYILLLFAGFMSLSSSMCSTHCMAVADEEASPQNHLHPSAPRISVEKLRAVLRTVRRSLQTCSSYILGPLCQSLTPPSPSVKKLRTILGNCTSRILNTLRRVLASDDRMSDDNAVTAAAALWLLETSTDPTTRSETLQLVPDLRWPSGMMSDRISLRHLDVLLDWMLECIDHGDGIHGATFISFGRAYLVLHVELLAFRDPYHDINVWAKQAHRVSKVKRISARLWLFVVSSTDDGEGTNLLRLLCIALETFYRRRGPDFSTSRPLGAFFIANYDVPATLTPNVYTATLLYLGHLCASKYVTWDSSSWELEQISYTVAYCGHISERDRSDHHRLLLVAMAMMLGHRPVITSGVQSSVKAARYLFSRAESDGGSRYFWGYLDMPMQLLDRLDGVLVILMGAVDPDSLRRERDSLEWSAVSDLAKHWIGDDLLHTQDDKWWNHSTFPRILELNVIVLSPGLIGINNLLPTHSSHLSPSTNSAFLWLPTYLEALGVTVGSSTMKDPSKRAVALWNTTANVFLLMSSSHHFADDWTRTADGGSTLINAVRWAMTAVMTSNHNKELFQGYRPFQHELYRLQCATLCILHSLLLSLPRSSPSEHPRYTLLRSHTLEFFTYLPGQEQFFPSLLASENLSFKDEPDIARDRTTVGIIRMLLRIDGGGMLDDVQDTSEDWSVDPASNPHLHAWIHLVYHWILSSNVQNLSLREIIPLFSIDSLLRCKMLRQPTKVWLDALPATMSRGYVTVVAIAAAWNGWVAWERQSTGRMIKNRTTLIKHTSHILNSLPTGWAESLDSEYHEPECVHEPIQDMLRISGSEADREEGLYEMQRSLETARDIVKQYLRTLD